MTSLRCFLQRASGQPATTWSLSERRQLPPQSSDILQQLLDLGRTPGEDEVFEVLSAELNSWRTNPRRATVILSSLARLRLLHTADNVLTVMLTNSVEANVFHYSAAISACGKGGQWPLALGLLNRMTDMRVIPDEISYN
ncbi:unnamed protein product, partial [Polarella glacialis]